MSIISPSGNTAIITGAASGIGRALAAIAAQAGMDLVLGDINERGVAAIAAELEAEGTRVLARQLDVSSGADNEAFVQAAFGWARTPIVFVFANAGVHGLTDGLNPDLKVWERAVGVNLFGPVNMAKAVIGRLNEQGVPAQFVVTGSQASFIAAPGMAPYVATKHAQWGFTDSLRQELRNADSPVGVSLVAPSRTASGLTQGQIDRAREQGGEAAAQAYTALLVAPERIAEVMFREACNRAFWIIPSHENVMPIFEARVAELLDAVPAGMIKIQANA